MNTFKDNEINNTSFDSMIDVIDSMSPFDHIISIDVICQIDLPGLKFYASVFMTGLNYAFGKRKDTRTSQFPGLTLLDFEAGSRTCVLHVLIKNPRTEAPIPTAEMPLQDITRRIADDLARVGMPFVAGDGIKIQSMPTRKTFIKTFMASKSREWRFEDCLVFHATDPIRSGQLRRRRARRHRTTGCKRAHGIDKVNNNIA